MKYFAYLFAVALLIMPFNDSAAAQDPYKNVTLHTLSNGMDVVLAPGAQADNVNLKVRVNVGRAVEDKNNLGVSHLLEHLIFRDSRFNDEQTYSDLVEENGGSINARVRRYETVYYATVPYRKGEWIVEQFDNMLFNHEVTQASIDRARSSVELETGEPSWLAEILGFDIFASLIHRYFPAPDFYESEFGMRQPYYSKDEYRLSNRRLTQDQIDRHYISYYHPSNMVLFVSGNFDAGKMLSFIEKKFGRHPDRDGETVPVLEPEMNGRPYRRVQYTSSSAAYIYIGTKYLDTTVREDISLMVYMDYVAHRIMKELRNKRGETYTANVYDDELHGAGYSVVEFETQLSEYEKNLQYVSSLMEKEVMQEALTDEQIKEAVNMTRQQRFELAENDADSIMVYAEHYYDYFQAYGIADSPYALLISITPDEFRKSLKHVFNNENSYTVLYLPYIYSKIELFAILVLSIVASIVVFQKLLKRRIDETRVQWTRKLSYSPAMFFEVIACFVFAFFLYHLIMAPIDRLLYIAEWYHSASLWPIYVNSFVSTFLITGIFMGCLSFLPRSIMIEGNAIVLKSMALYARRFERPSIRTIKTMSLFKLVMSPKIWFNFKFRFFYNTVLFWRRGLLLELSDGMKYFMDFKNADQVSDVLNEHIFGDDEDINADSETELEKVDAGNRSAPAVE